MTVPQVGVCYAILLETHGLAVAYSTSSVFWEAGNEEVRGEFYSSLHPLFTTRAMYKTFICILSQILSSLPKLYVGMSACDQSHQHVK